jgi:chromosome segregation ATPase
VEGKKKEQVVDWLEMEKKYKKSLEALKQELEEKNREV